MKTKNILFIITFLFSFAVPYNIFSNNTTFPENEAGIAAYVKLDGVNSENNQTILTKINNFLANNGSVEDTGEASHILGTLEIEIKEKSDSENVIFSISPQIYADASGWLVAYFPNDVPASKMIRWNGYTPENGLKSNVLEKAIDRTAQSIDKTYSAPKYYHFQYPDANRMTVITSTVYNPEREDGVEYPEDNFSVTIPEGTVYEASYSIYYSRKLASGQSCNHTLKVNENIIHEKQTDAWCRGDNFIYDTFGSFFTPGNQHLVTFNGKGGARPTSLRMGAASVFLYGENE